MPTSHERQPLLSRPSATTAASNGSPSPALEHIVATLAAIRAGKLPTTSQLCHLIDTALASSLFAAELGTILEPRYGTGRIGTGALSREGERVRQRMREMMQLVREMMRERNGDDAMQKCVYALRHLELRLGEFVLHAAGETSEIIDVALLSQLLHRRVYRRPRTICYPSLATR